MLYTNISPKDPISFSRLLLSALVVVVAVVVVVDATHFSRYSLLLRA